MHASRVLRRGCSRSVVRCEASSKAKFFVGGNWKSNGTKASLKQLVDGLNAGASSFDPSRVDVVVAPTYVHLDFVSQHLDTSKYHIAGQNIWLKGPGAYTGEIAGETLQDLGVQWAIVGHSERRQLCGETDEIVGQKVARALELGMGVIPCIGETLQQRQDGQLWQVLDKQLSAIVNSVKCWDKVVLAYEPVWAIGTGVVATPEQAQEVHHYLRGLLESKIGRLLAAEVRILYGGSVNDKNCQELAALADVDGFLVGGASLQASAFLTIIKSHAVKQQAAGARW